MAMQLCVGEIGSLASQGVRGLLDGVLGGVPIADYAEADRLEWSVLAEGGWDELGVPEEAGGAGATLRDLTEVAVVWGGFCAPAPLIETVVAKRWSAGARGETGPVTIAVPTASGPVAPFGATSRVLSGLGAPREGFLADVGGPADPFAPTLRPVPVGEATVFAADAARELAVMWAAEGVGAARRSLTDAVEYAKGRKQFGVPIGSFQAIKHRAAHTLELVERAETAVLWAAVGGVAEGAEPVGTRRLLLHSLVTSQEVVESCIQIYGGMGFTWEMGVHVYLRHIVTLRELVEGLLPGPA